MTYTYCERLMWAAIAPAAFRYLARQELGWDISALKQLSKQIYRQMVSRTPDIGSMMENPLRVCLTGGILWLSIYKAAEEKMSEKCFEGMVSASMRSPLVVAAFRGKAKTAFTLKAQYSEQRLHLWRMQIGTPFSGMPRSSSAGMQRNRRSFTTRAVCVPWADRRAFLIWFPIYALWTRCPSTGWVGGSTVPKRWLPAVTAVTCISAKRVPVGTKNGRENRKRKI